MPLAEHSSVLTPGTPYSKLKELWWQSDGWSAMTSEGAAGGRERREVAEEERRTDKGVTERDEWDD
jgi:hypothetical protein